MIYEGFIDDFWRIYGRFMEDLEGFMEDLWRIYGGFMEEIGGFIDVYGGLI